MNSLFGATTEGLSASASRWPGPPKPKWDATPETFKAWRREAKAAIASLLKEIANFGPVGFITGQNDTGDSWSVEFDAVPPGWTAKTQRNWEYQALLGFLQAMSAALRVGSGELAAWSANKKRAKAEADLRILEPLSQAEREMLPVCNNSHEFAVRYWRGAKQGDRALMGIAAHMPKPLHVQDLFPRKGWLSLSPEQPLLAEVVFSRIVEANLGGKESMAHVVFGRPRDGHAAIHVYQPGNFIAVRADDAEMVEALSRIQSERLARHQDVSERYETGRRKPWLAVNLEAVQ